MAYHYTKGLPTLYEIRKCVPDITTEPELEASLTKLFREDPYGDGSPCYKTNLVMLETLLKYRGMYVLEEYSELIEYVIFCLQEMNFRQYRYLEQARRKLDYRFRLNGRKKYIDFCISHSLLGKDVASVICGFL